MIFRWFSEQLRLRSYVRNSQVFRSLFRSFLALAVLPLTVLCLDFLEYQRIIKTDTQSYEHALLEQVQQTVDERLESICQLAISLSLDADIEDFVSGKTLNSSQVSVASWKIADRFGSDKITYSSVEDIMLYSPAHRRVVTSVYTATVPVSSNMLLEDELLNSRLMSAFAQERMYCSFLNLAPDQNREDTLFLLHSVPLWSTRGDAQGTLAIQVNTASLFDKFQNIEEWEDGLIALVDGEGNILAYMGDPGLLTQAAISVGGDSGQAQDLTYEGKSYTLFSVASNQAGWQYLSIQSKAHYLSGLYTVLGSHALIILAVVVLEVMIAWILSWRNYTPVDKIMKTIQKDLTASTMREELSEYHIIENSLQGFLYSLKEIQSQVEQEVPKMQEIMMQQWLNGTVSDYPAYKSSLNQIGILMPFPHYSIVYIEIMEYPTERTEEHLLLRAAAHSKVVQFFPENVSWGAADIGENGFVLVVNAADSKLDREMEQALNEAVNHLRTELFLSVWAGLGTPTDQMQEIPHQYFQLKQILHASRMENQAGVKLLRSHADCTMLYYCPEELLRHVSNAISLGKTEEVLQLVRDNIRHNFSNTRMQTELVLNYFYLLTDAVLRGLPTQDDGFTDFWNESTPMAALARADSPDKMQSILEMFIRNACCFTREHQQSQAHVLMRDILDYLEENYMDSTVSLSLVAEQFQITPNYLSTFFRENTGKTFLNYLTALRITRAKELLRQTDMTIAEIATKVGYSGSNSFIRNYKKMEHVTPGEYRSALRS